jgi:neutral ceramidase
VRRAHFNVRPAEIFYSEGELHDANINRSPTSYLANPESERQRLLLNKVYKKLVAKIGCKNWL